MTVLKGEDRGRDREREGNCKRYVEKLKIHTAAMRSHKFAEAANSG